MFHASCETVFRPDLWGKPVVVLPSNDGRATARSAEAKALGVKMGDPWSRQKDLFRRCGVVRLSSNYELYTNMSSRVMSTLEELSPRVKIYSINEAFCDLTDVYNYRNLVDFGREIRATVLQRTYLTAGVGIVQTKTLARPANYMAKRWQRQAGGVVNLSNLERQRKLISALPAGEVWGIGRQISKKLDAMRIRTALDLADSGIRFICRYFSVVLKRAVRKLRGEPCLQLGEFIPTKQEIICSYSFGECITDYPSIRQVICNYTTRAAEKLRGKYRYCRFISMFIKTSPFASNESYYDNNASVKPLVSTQNSRDVTNAAAQSLDVIWQVGCHYQKAGVIPGDFFSQGVTQLNLFDDNVPYPGSR